MIETFSILALENLEEQNIEELSRVLKIKAPQFNWVVSEEKILNFHNELEVQKCIKVPKSQYEGADYVYRLMTGCRGYYLDLYPYLEELRVLAERLSDTCSDIVDEDEFEEYLANITTILLELYSFGVKLPEVVNLNFEVAQKLPGDHFPNDLLFPKKYFEEELIYQNNINFILKETSQFDQFLKHDPNMNAAGVVHEIYRSFHSLDGWGKRIIDTIDLIHQIKSKVIHSNLEVDQSRRKVTNLKKEADKWVKERIAIDGLLQSDFFEHPIYSFPLVGFADEPEVFVQSTFEGIAIGYHSIAWHGHIPEPVSITKHLVYWETLELLSDVEQEKVVLDTLMKTINSRKRQYKTCQFCGKSTPPGHRFNDRTCHGCATKYFHVIY
ncbi:hypothetical protein ABLO26_24420 [Neobacillus sp. 179-J 1A1 HS]|uniref:hypothetical protein n=1 Tax=Neobacillus driksii TaxID=3035913 RepID=UPI0035BC6357